MPIPAPWWANGGEGQHAGSKTPTPKKPAPKKPAVVEADPPVKKGTAKGKPGKKQNGAT
jgi:hypothetical protein